MLSAQTKAYALTVAGGLWFGIVVFVVTGHVIMRATAVGIIATDVDMLPSRIREIVFFSIVGPLWPRLDSPDFLCFAASLAQRQASEWPNKRFRLASTRVF